MLADSYRSLGTGSDWKVSAICSFRLGSRLVPRDGSARHEAEWIVTPFL
jgi:hypothetical protein